MKYRAPRGTHDLIGSSADNLRLLEDQCREIFTKYGFQEIITPTFEDAALFSRTIGETTDIVEKEMYVFNDRKGRNLALRPEGTAGIVRAYIEKQLAQDERAGKLFYMGPMFRYERPQAGRYREFYQIGAENIGNGQPYADAEMIILCKKIFDVIGIPDVTVHINSLGCPECRPKFRDALVAYFKSQTDLCDDCKRRIKTNPLRVLDCKIDGPKAAAAPQMADFLDDECKAHFDQVKTLLDAANCSFKEDHRLVRGLDYYSRTVFEVRSSAVGSQDALAAGGRYDSLVRDLGGSETPAVGFALGSERVLLALQNSGKVLRQDPGYSIFVAVSGASVEKDAFQLVAKLRSAVSYPSSLVPESIKGCVRIEGPYSDKSLKSQLKLADKLKAQKTIIVGEEELSRKSVLVRDMVSQTQTEIPIIKITE